MKILIIITLLLFSFSSFSFYPHSYKESREHFIKQAKKLKDQHPRLKLNSLKIPTFTNENLTTETLYISQSHGKKERLLIITSGTHGAEAFTGSAIQSLFMNEILSDQLLEDMGILIVHAVNPYGFHFKRRVSENNVDLNRNFSANEQHFTSKNSSYEKLEKFLNPVEPLNSSFSSDIKLFIRTLFLLVEHGKQKLTQSIVGGQYQFNKSLYFGGAQSEPNVNILKKEFSKYGKGYQSIFHIDLHTGYGERGKLHYFINKNTVAQSPALQKLFEGYTIDTESNTDFYETSGDFSNFTLQTFPQKKVIPIVFEFGTMDSQDIIGSFLSLKNMIYENQGFHYGYTSSESKLRTQEQFMDMFNPSSQEWREKVLKTSRKELSQILKRYSEMSLSND